MKQRSRTRARPIRYVPVLPILESPNRPANHSTVYDLGPPESHCAAPVPNDGALAGEVDRGSFCRPNESKRVGLWSMR